ncbi:MAG: cell division protein FtsZ [Candidatus Micrarchaeota archaeon]|nr:cell division protein FtsZ [Candidatus Micrarchaeota archaeon]
MVLRKGIRMKGLSQIVEQARNDAPACFTETEKEGVKITIAGVGGAGCNALSNLKDIKSAETIAINTDAVHLKSVEAQRKILLGAGITKGMGAGGFPELAMKCAEAHREELAEALEGTELLFITAGLGGGTGTGAAPIIAEVAKELGAVVVAAVNYPFAIERVRIIKAEWGLDALMRVCDTVIVLDNNRLTELVPNLPLRQAFAVADGIVARAVKGISDAITLPSLVNLSFADVRSIMTGGGLAVIAVGEGSGAFKAQEAVKSTVRNPLLEVTYKGAKGALIHVSGGSTMTLKEVTDAGEMITKEFDKNANVVWGARIEDRLADKMIITAIATGVSSPKIRARETLEDVEKEKIALEIANP